MKRNSLIIILAILTIIGGIGLYAKNSGVFGPKVVLHADWVTKYDGVTQLYDDADLVIVGTVLDHIPWIVYGSSDTATPVVMTNYTFTVTNLIKGDIDTETVLVYMTGGSSEGHTYELTDSPLLENGDKQVLFLKKGYQNSYYVLGGPQGRFTVINDKVYSTSEYEENENPTTKHLQTKGMDLLEFLKQLE